MAKLFLGLILILLIMAGTFGINIWVMTCGWGVAPASWGVIIGGWLICIFLLGLLELVKTVFKD